MGIRRQGSGGRKHVPEEEEASLKSQKRRRGRESSRRRLSGEGGGGGVREGKRHSRMIYSHMRDGGVEVEIFKKKKPWCRGVCLCSVMLRGQQQPGGRRDKEDEDSRGGSCSKGRVIRRKIKVHSI